ncbi:hypothetical protein CNMCM7691_005627 [Aspergillus felis]|uniref:Zn(2)-C6 fungal-type domain-containing protein n=1 Tax=Aspergillus felis TaxID=1287682 RepID=A0A8H6QSG1_9EURO|nr:hypothetical protein CNMCM7691_005627 [Aspergillus felis]
MEATQRPRPSLLPTLPPIGTSLPYRLRHSADVADARKDRPDTGQFIKYGHPFQSLHRFFVGLEPMWSDVSAIEFTEDSPVGYVKKLTVAGEVPVNRLSETCHHNIVNLREVFISERSIFFVYEKWGISLEEIHSLSPVFQLGEVEVATICREVLKGLQYMHKLLGITHGNLSLSNIHIMEDGSVKIGESMVTSPEARDKSADVQAVCALAGALLELDDMPGTRGTIGLLASDFVNAPPTATIDELLKVSSEIFESPGRGGVVSSGVNLIRIAFLPEIQCRELVFASGQHPLHALENRKMETFKQSADKKTPPPPASVAACALDLPRSDTSLTMETEYVRMLLELQDIHWFYNSVASLAAWMLLAGYLVIPGTFTSLQRSDSLTNEVAQNDAGKAILKTIQNPPLVAIALTLLGIGAAIMSFLFYRWRRNYLWLINRLFIPTLLNTAAGLLTTLINIYTAKDKCWSIMALLTVVVSGVLAASSAGLTIVYKFWKLRIVLEDHEREIRAGLCKPPEMDSDFQGQGTPNSSFSSAVRTREKDIRAFFTPARQWLRSVLELSRAQVAVLRGEYSLARYFNVPFASDSIAERVENLFGELRVLKDENGELDNGIRWIDVLLAPTYEPTPQEDGSLHLRLDGRKGLIKMSTSDHDLIKTGIPQQLLNPRTYESDVLAERETMKLVEQELAFLNEVASQIINTNDDGLSRLGERFEALGQLRNEPGHSQEAQPIFSIGTDSQAHAQCETSTGSPERTTQGASTTNRPWTSEERARVPQWFRARKHLPRKEVVAQFEQDFGHHRSFGAIQTASYYRPKTKDDGNPRKRRRTLAPGNPSPRPTTTETARATEPSNDVPRSLTTDSIPRANISFLDALKSFPRPEVPRAELNQPKVVSAESLQAANAEEPSNAAGGTSWNERSSSSTSASEIRSPGQAVTGALLPTVGEAVVGCVSSGNDYRLTQLSSTNDRDGNGPCNANTENRALGTPAGFRPVNLGSRPGSGAVDMRAHASMTVAMIPTVNTHQLDTRNTDSGPTGHAVAADSAGHISLGISKGGSVPGPQMVTRAQPNGGETLPDLLNESREGISSSPSQREHQSLSVSVPETEPRIIASALGPCRPQSSNTNRSQDLSQLSSHIPAAQQLNYSAVQFTEAQQLESQSHQHQPYHTGTATPAGPTPSEKSNPTIRSASKEKLTRSRTGCSACRKKRVECDGNSPTCDNCARSGLPCDGPRKSRRPGHKPSAQQRIVVLKYAGQAGMCPKGGASSVSDGNPVTVAERIDSSGEKACVSDCTTESTQQRSISEARIGSTSVSNGGPITPFSNFAWGQETLPGSLVSPTACELPSIANLAPGRYEIPSIHQIFDWTSPSPH